jgi:hypothetical protein
VSDYTSRGGPISLGVRLRHAQAELLQREETPRPPTGPPLVKYIEAYLDGLTDQELTVFEKLLERQAEIDKPYGVPPRVTDQGPPATTMLRA